MWFEAAVGVIALSYSRVGLFVEGVDSNCTGEDFDNIHSDSMDSIQCMVNTSSDSWITTCFPNVTETCANSVGSDVTDFIDDCVALNVTNSTLPCEAVSLGTSLARNSPGASDYCSVDDAEVITNINMTTVSTCASGNITATFGCWLDELLTMNLTTPCQECYEEGRGSLEIFCGGGGLCGTPGYDDDCTACVNAFLAEGTTYCLGASDTITHTTTKFAAGPAAFHITAILLLAVVLVSV